MAFFETILDAFGNLNVGGASLYTLADVGLILAVGIAVFFIGKSVYDKVVKTK